MTKTDRILEETERTLRSWDEEAGLPADPYLAARIEAMHAERAASRWNVWRPLLQLRFAAILALMVLNMITILYLELSARPDPAEHLVSVLRDDFQIESSQDIP